MEYALDRFAREAHAVLVATGQAPDELIELVTPKPNIPADLAFPAFRAAKQLNIAPPQLAQRIAAAVRLAPGSLVSGVTAAGPFVNFSIDPALLADAVLGEVERMGETYGGDDLGKQETIVIDYSSPNVAKRMHAGHIRTTIIGQSLVNILRRLGYHVIGDNHLGDWGKQFGAILAAVQHYGEPQGEGEEVLAGFEEIYTRYNNAMKDDPALDEEARAWSLRLEQGDPQARAIWQRAVDLTLRVSQRIYDRLGVAIDHAYGESFYEPMLAGVIEEALAKGVAYRDDGGAVVVDELEPNLPTFLLQRSDGGTLYMTRDVATIKFRIAEFKPARIIYVLGIPQELHLRQLFALCRALNHVEGVDLVHVKFGTIFDQSGQALSTRRGNMVYLEALLNEAHTRARAVVEQASPELPEDEKDAIAEAVGVGAVVYNDLYQDPRRDIRLDWDRMLALEGNSAPYIQYMQARCRSIIRRAAEEGYNAADGDAALLTHPSETAVVKQLAKLPGAVREAGARYTPFVIAEWCYDTARALSGFYRDCSVLKAETAELRAARLRLVAATAQSLRNGLALLGIRAPERM